MSRTANITTSCVVIVDHENTYSLQHTNDPWFVDNGGPGERFVEAAIFLPQSDFPIVHALWPALAPLVMNWRWVTPGSCVCFYRADGSGCLFRIV